MNESPPGPNAPWKQRKNQMIAALVVAGCVIATLVVARQRSIYQGPITTRTPVSAADPRTRVTCGIINCDNSRPCPEPRSGLSCTVENRQGSRRINVCWDNVVACRGGNRMTAHVCQVVQAGASARRLIAVTDFVGADRCEKAAGTAIVNLTVSAQ